MLTKYKRIRKTARHMINDPMSSAEERELAKFWLSRVNGASVAEKGWKDDYFLRCAYHPDFEPQLILLKHNADEGEVTAIFRRPGPPRIAVFPDDEVIPLPWHYEAKPDFDSAILGVDWGDPDV